MELRTISATSLLSFEECPRRWVAENLNRTPRSGSSAPADVGTTCHYAMEKYVEAVYINKTASPELDVLLMFAKIGYEDTFKSTDFSTPEYKDCVDMLKRWWGRQQLEGRTILSLEKKMSIPIKTSAGEIPYNFIWDRCDAFIERGRKIIQVTDYKTIRQWLDTNELKRKIQARMYAMAAATIFKDDKPDEIRIVFDLLRHDEVEVRFSREENVATWKWIRSTAERIIAMDENKAPEQLGPGCQWCVRKTTCKTLQKNAVGGGIMSMDDDELYSARVMLEAQQKAAGYALKEIDELILAKAKERDETEWETDQYIVKFASVGRRVVDNDEAAQIIGESMMAQLGKLSISDIDALLKGDELDAAQKSLLRGTISKKFSDPKPKIERKLGV